MARKSKDTNIEDGFDKLAESVTGTKVKSKKKSGSVSGSVSVKEKKTKSSQKSSRISKLQKGTREKPVTTELSRMQLALQAREKASPIPKEFKKPVRSKSGSASGSVSVGMEKGVETEVTPSDSDSVSDSRTITPPKSKRTPVKKISKDSEPIVTPEQEEEFKKRAAKRIDEKQKERELKKEKAAAKRMKISLEEYRDFKQYQKEKQLQKQEKEEELKKPRGRPRIKEKEEIEVKRPRGRPRKDETAPKKVKTLMDVRGEVEEGKKPIKVKVSDLKKKSRLRTPEQIEEDRERLARQTGKRGIKPDEYELEIVPEITRPKETRDELIKRMQGKTVEEIKEEVARMKKDKGVTKQDLKDIKEFEKAAIQARRQQEKIKRYKPTKKEQYQSSFRQQVKESFKEGREIQSQMIGYFGALVEFQEFDDSGKPTNKTISRYTQTGLSKQAVKSNIIKLAADINTSQYQVIDVTTRTSGYWMIKKVVYHFKGYDPEARGGYEKLEEQETVEGSELEEYNKSFQAEVKEESE